MTNEFSAPECYVTGNITIQGETIDVIPEKSAAWYDRQFGPGFPSAGWNVWVLLLSNGVKAEILHTNPVGNDPPQILGTFVFPDGHHEIYPIDKNIHGSNPFVSKATGFTYFKNFEVTVPGMDTTLFLDQPFPVGEVLIPSVTPTKANTLSESFATAKGIFKGKQVTGYGVIETSLNT